MSTKQAEIFHTLFAVPQKVKVSLNKHMLLLKDPPCNGYTIKMKIVYAHFPITVKTKDKLVLVENFQGERAPRTAKIHGATKVASKGDEVVVTRPVLNDVTQTAAEIQAMTKVKNKDHRVFLDGIYQYHKTKGIEKEFFYNLLYSYTLVTIKSHAPSTT